MFTRSVHPVVKAASFAARGNSTLSNTASTVKMVNSVKSGQNPSQTKTNNIISEALGSPSTDYSSSFFSKRSFAPLSSTEPDPYDYATRDLDRAVYQFDSLVRSNRLREVSYDQRFYTKPNKRRLAKRVANRKRVFESGIAKLFEVVKDAVRKGY
ncbi:hypothetical protein PMKS-002358 [Pichia membranifaciens]|uniref:Ribosomal protein S21 n=1 Tax=Pichia membranifaciens TaxID=4926 RepID=A0A1Q2YH32_9ASCO|nr:hypothetical protein PMKS-002358 [Pichia membranifaciens]